LIGTTVIGTFISKNIITINRCPFLNPYNNTGKGRQIAL
jgi:hypothetical protein